jgi:Tol biopolymer transport system component
MTMADLEERFRSLERSSVPDLWPDASTRRPGPPPQPPAGRRIVAGVVALALAAAATFGAAIAFRHSAPRPATPVGNGRIAFSGFDGTTWQILSVEPDGSGLSTLTTMSDLELAAEPTWSPDGQRIAFVVQRFQADGGTGRSDIWVMEQDGGDAHALTDGPGSSWAPSWSPDGTRIAFMRSSSDGAEEVWTMDGNGSDPHPFTLCGPPECVSDTSPTWSPDGGSIAFVRSSGAGAVVPLSIMVWPADGTGRTRSIPIEGATWADELAWSPDGLEFAFTRSFETGTGFGLAVVDADGTSLRPLTDMPSAQAAAWSPDGRQVAFMAMIEATGREGLFVMSADGTSVREIPGLEADAASPSWQPIRVQPEPTGAAPPPKGNGPIYFRIGGGDAGSWIDSILADGTGRTTVFPIDAGPRYARISFSPDGSRIAYDDAPNGLVTAAADGSDPFPVTDGVNDSWPVWSPDGSRIAFSSTRYDPTIDGCTPGFPHEFRCPTDIYVMDLEGSNVERLTDDPVGEFMPVWSPDGSRIAFVREGVPGDTYEGVYTMAPDGSDVRRVSSSSGGSDFWPSWSPDGSKLAFAAIRNEDWGIWVVDADGSDEHRILGGTGAGYVDNPVWSRDGTLIAFVGNMAVDDYSPEDALYVMCPDGTGVTPIADAPRYGVAGDIAWQPIPAGTIASPLEPSSVEVRVTTTTGVAEFPSAVAAGEGGVWVTGSSADGSRKEVIRLDPGTGEVVARIPVRAVPGWEFGGAGLTVAEGAVWLVDTVGGGPTCCHAFVTRIDPSTNQVADGFELPGEVAFGADIWVEGGAAYVLSFVEGGSGLELAKVDAASHALVWRAPVPGRWAQTVFLAGGSAWVLGTPPDSHGPIEVTMLYRIDPGSGAVLDEIPLNESMYIPSIQSDALWFRTMDGAQRFDPVTASLVGEPVRPASGCCTGPFVSDGSGGVWIVSSAGAGHAIWHVAASGTVVAAGTIEDKDAFEQMGGQSYAFDPETQTIWVQHYEDSIARVEIALSSAGA